MTKKKKKKKNKTAQAITDALMSYDMSSESDDTINVVDVLATIASTLNGIYASLDKIASTLNLTYVSLDKVAKSINDSKPKDMPS